MLASTFVRSLRPVVMVLAIPQRIALRAPATAVVLGAQLDLYALAFMVLVTATSMGSEYTSEPSVGSGAFSSDRELSSSQSGKRSAAASDVEQQHQPSLQNTWTTQAPTKCTQAASG